MLVDLMNIINVLENQKFYHEADTLQNIFIKIAQNKRRLNMVDFVAPLSMLNLHTPAPNQAPNPSVMPTQPEHQMNIIDYSNQTAPKGGKARRSNFKKDLHFIYNVEGSISNRNRRRDPGGLTSGGITQGTYNMYLLKHNHKPKSVRHITEQEKADIYRTMYWQPIQAGKLPAATALALFNWKVNGGNAVKALQKLIGVNPDGIMGQDTINKVWQFISYSKEEDQMLAKQLSEKQIEYQRSLPIYKYNHGWETRKDKLDETIETE